MNRKTNLYVLAATLFVALLAMPAVSATSHDADNENTVEACLLYTSDAADE